jgi:Transmembrane protein family 232
LDCSQIAVLFYVAESALYWVRTETVNQPFMSLLELQWLSIARLVFVRLYFHHMAGQLGSFQEMKKRLFTYIDGLFSRGV